MTRIDSDDVNGLWKYSTNTYPLSENTFKYEFEVSYVGPKHPEGRCYSDLGGDGGSSLGTTPSVTAQPTTVAMK